MQLDEPKWVALCLSAQLLFLESSLHTSSAISSPELLNALTALYCTTCDVGPDTSAIYVIYEIAVITVSDNILHCVP